jgi:hypothetical protein
MIYLRDSAILKSTHTTCLAIPWLPEAARGAHIVPGLNHTSLISIKSLCNAGCIITYITETYNVSYSEKVIWQGHSEPTTGLRVFPWMPDAPKRLAQSPININIKPKLTEAAHDIHALTSKESLVKFLHQCLFSPPK